MKSGTSYHHNVKRLSWVKAFRVIPEISLLSVEGQPQNAELEFIIIVFF